MPPERSDYITKQFRTQFAKYLRKKRDRLEMSRERFAEHLGLTGRYITTLEEARGLPSRAVAERIWEIFDEPQTALLKAGFLPRPGMKLASL